MNKPYAAIFLAVCFGLTPVLSPAAEPETAGVAQQNATLTGNVRNAATGAYLEGAVVVLEPGHRRVLTERDGSFRFVAVPPGDYRIRVSYTGLDAQETSITAAAGDAAPREYALTSEVYAMEKFTVAGEREGNALAITQQRNAYNVKNVISADAFGNIADQNVGNLLMRLPGVAEYISEGEVAAVNIRGIGSDMNSVSVDGTRGASGSTGVMDRGFTIDRIPADFVERIELTKALTPDMDGDAIGGAINLRTKSPLDHKGRIISYMAGTSWNENRNKFEPIGSFAYSDILGQDRKLGLLVTSSYNKTYKPRDSVYQNWQATANSPAYFWMSNIGEDALEHERIGIGARVDYQLSKGHRVFLNTLLSEYNDRLDRRQISMSPTAAQIRPGWSELITETTNHPVTFTQLSRERTVETINFVFGGEKRFATSVIDYGANFSDSVGTEDRVIPTVQAMGVGFRLDRTADPKYPVLTQISGPDIYDRRDHRITALSFQDFDDKDTIKGAHINWKNSFATDAPTSLKTGLRYRGQERERKQKRPAYSYLGADGILGRNDATGVNDDNVGQFADLEYTYRPAHGRYLSPPALYLDRLVSYFRAHPAYFPENILATERDARQFNGNVMEDVYAAYLMGDIRLGRLDIVGGVRVEETHLASRGVRQEITPEEAARRRAWIGTVTNDELRRRTIAEWSNLREDKAKYRNVLPSLHFKYNITDSMIARLSYSTGIGRPNYTDLLRATSVNNDTMTITAANPGLKPQTADNFDLSLEYYFEPAGVISAGVFLKEIKDFIYGDRGGVVAGGANNGFDGEYEGYSLTSNFNGGSARVRGLELAYNQRFTFLPGIWKGFGLMANYTRLESQGNYSASGGTTTGAELAGFMPETFNGSLSYTRGRWFVQAQMTYRHQNLRDFSSNPLQRVYYYSKKNWDLNLKYNLSPHLSLFADVINVFDAGTADAFINTFNRTRYTQVFTTAVKAGISGRF